MKCRKPAELLRKKRAGHIRMEKLHPLGSGVTDVKKLNKGEILTSIAVVILLFTAMINWNIYSWLVLLAIIVILAAWYFRK